MSRKPFLSGWLAALLGGLTYLLLNLAIELAFPDHWAGSPDRLLGMGYAGWSRLLWIPTALLLFGFVGLYRHLAPRLGQLARVGYFLAIIGALLNIAGNIIEFWVYGVFLVPLAGEFTTGSAGSQMGYEIGSYGAMASIFGLLLFGFACLRSALPVRWRFLPILIALTYLSIFYFFFAGWLAIHAVLYGLVWMLMGYFLWSEKSELPS